MGKILDKPELRGGATVGGVEVINTSGIVVANSTQGAFNIATNLTFTKAINHTAGVSTSTTATNAGGNLTYTAGTGATTGAGGTITVTGGAGGNDAVGGVAALVGGAAGGGNRAGGNASVTGGAGAGTAVGGASAVVGGISGTGATGNGGNASVTGGAAASTNGNGGSAVVTPGAKAGSGVNGVVFLRGTVASKTTVTAMTTTASMTVAGILGGIITANQGAAGAATYTTPTGAQIAAALPSDFTTGDSFDFSIVNISTNAAEDVTVAAGASGITMVGNVTVASNDAVGTVSFGRFRVLQTNAATYSIYRIA